MNSKMREDFQRAIAQTQQGKSVGGGIERKITFSPLIKASLTNSKLDSSSAYGNFKTTFDKHANKDRTVAIGIQTDINFFSSASYESWRYKANNVGSDYDKFASLLAAAVMDSPTTAMTFEEFKGLLVKTLKEKKLYKFTSPAMGFDSLTKDNYVIFKELREEHGYWQMVYEFPDGDPAFKAGFSMKNHVEVGIYSPVWSTFGTQIFSWMDFKTVFPVTAGLTKQFEHELNSGEFKPLNGYLKHSKKSFTRRHSLSFNIPVGDSDIEQFILAIAKELL